MSHMKRCHFSRGRVARKPSSRDASADPLQVMVGSALCELRIWTEEEWDLLSDAQRPSNFIYAPGLGWLGAVPVEILN